MAHFVIREAEATDAPLLPAVERSAAQTFLQLPGYEWLATGDTQSVEEHLDYIKRGVEWVAVDAANLPIAFLNGSLAERIFHIHEISVQSSHQGKGVGRGLISTAKQWAIASGCSSITLTTFPNVPWNELFYRSLGFRILDTSGLTAFLEAVMKNEADVGLPIKDRCAMSLNLEWRYQHVLSFLHFQHLVDRVNKRQRWRAIIGRLPWKLWISSSFPLSAPGPCAWHD